MSTVEKIVAAAAKLNPSQLAKLRQKLDRLEQQTWEAELAVVTAKRKKAKITDEEIDQKIMRRRREGRA